MTIKINGAQFKVLYRYKMRRAKVILAHLLRINGPSSVNSKLILRDMNAKICIKYGIPSLKELPAEKMEDCKEFIKAYQYLYFGDPYG